MAAFTKFQKDEILSLIENRLETILSDEESADDFETEESLNILSEKIKNNSIDFTIEEKKWMLEELENRIEIAKDWSQPHEHMSRMAFIKSLNNAVDKIIS